MQGVYVLWWVQEKQVSAAVVAAILAAGDLAVALLEVPTGWFADRCGHRASLIIGSVLQIAGMLMAWLGAGIPGILASSLIIAAGDTFRSGADQALLYRSCVALGQPAFQAIEARARALQLVALVALIVIGGAIVDVWGFAAGWFTETLVSAAGLAIACAMIEPPAAADLSSETRPAPSTPSATTTLKRIGALIPIVVPAAVLGGAASAAMFLVQSDAIRPMRMTLLVAGMTLAEAIGALAATRVGAGMRGQMALCTVGMVLSVAALFAPAIFLPVAVALCLLMGLVQPLRATAIQRAASDDVRARAASVASACDKALMTMALVAAGWLSRFRS